jgi:hypothetical protein
MGVKEKQPEKGPRQRTMLDVKLPATILAYHPRA